MQSRLVHSTRATLATLATLALSACASSPGGGGGAASTTDLVGPQSPQRVADLVNVKVMPTGAEAASIPIATSPASTWAALTSAYGDLKLTPDHLVSAAMTIGVDNLRLRNSFAGQPLSAYVDCGSRITGPVANSYEVTLTIRSQVKPRDAESQLLTVISATARPVGVSGNVLSCTSTGGLEQRIAVMVAQHVVGK